MKLHIASFSAHLHHKIRTSVLNTSFANTLQFRPTAIAAAALSLCAGQAQAIEPFVVKDIRVEGVQRTEAGTVFSYLPVRVGDTFDDLKSTQAIKTLYSTGFFKDVQLEAQNGVLFVIVEERPTISKVDFTGTKAFEKDLLVKALKDIGVSDAKIYDKATVDRAEQELKRQYLAKGLYGVKVETKITPIERNRVNITFAIEEGDNVKIEQINIIGNKAFSDKELKSNITLTTPGWFTWLSKNDQYAKQKLTGDLEAIRSFYQNRGYIEMDIESYQVSISADKQKIYITINLHEGEKYTVSDIKLEGGVFGREAELNTLFQLKKGDIYSAAKLTDSTKRITDRMGNYGYAFANVNANPVLDVEKKEVALTVFVDPGKRVYVRRIEFSGNTRTRDEVIRREFRQVEGSWYDGEKIRLSKDRVARLGYFADDLSLDTPEVATSADQVDVNLKVTEKPTGVVSFGIGYSQYEGAVIQGGFQQANVAGSGDTIGIELNTSQVNRTISVSHFDPYFTQDGVSRGFDAYLRTSRPLINSVGDFRVVSQGGNLRFGIPFSELDSVVFGMGFERTKVDAVATSPTRYRSFVAQYGNNPSGIGSATTTAYPLTLAWQRDSRDSVVTPSAGLYQNANVELAAIGSFKYYRATYIQQRYIPVYRTVTLALNGEANYGRGLGGNSYPVFKNYYAGGIGTVRGYDTSTLGSVSSNGDPTGGSTRVYGNAELQVPFSGTDRSLRFFTFFDIGNVFDEGQKVQFKDLRHSAGFGISWLSPMGPLKLSLGKALNAKPDDKLQRFQFQIGGGF
jgi:outer membrane protein insertion porin family